MIVKLSKLSSKALQTVKDCRIWFLLFIFKTYHIFHSYCRSYSLYDLDRQAFLCFVVHLDCLKQFCLFYMPLPRPCHLPWPRSPATKTPGPKMECLSHPYTALEWYCQASQGVSVIKVYCSLAAPRLQVLGLFTFVTPWLLTQCGYSTTSTWLNELNMSGSKLEAVYDFSLTFSVKKLPLSNLLSTSASYMGCVMDKSQQCNSKPPLESLS